MNMDTILSILVAIASAMLYLHNNGLIHCDLKPENILLKPAHTEGGFIAKLSDFGMSELADGSSQKTSRGTFTHMAPEVITDGKVRCSVS
jgi:serine/threonine protein kinase